MANNTSVVLGRITKDRHAEMLRKGFAHYILPLASDFNSNSPVNGINPEALHVGEDQLLSLTRWCPGLTEATAWLCFPLLLGPRSWAVCESNNRDAWQFGQTASQSLYRAFLLEILGKCKTAAVSIKIFMNSKSSKIKIHRNSKKKIQFALKSVCILVSRYPEQTLTLKWFEF